MIFHDTKAEVLNRGEAPDAWLTELVTWGKAASEGIFAPNSNPADIYALIRPTLGPWSSLDHRRAAMLEVMRVHAGFESSWNWDEGVDTTNKSSMTNPDGAEAGAWQVSADSRRLGPVPLAMYEEIVGDLPTVNEKAREFQRVMKCDHVAAMEYYAWLVRTNIKWAGPLLDSRFTNLSHSAKILPWLNRDAVAEFQTLLAA